MRKQIILSPTPTKANGPMKKLSLLQPYLLKAIPLLVLALLPRASTACLSDELESVHFNSAFLDFGTVPRRGAVAYDQTDRPITKGEAFNCSNGLAIYEFSRDRDVNRSRARHRLYDRLLKEAFAYESGGHWKKALDVYGRLVVQAGWTGEVRDRVEAITQYLSLSKPRQLLLAPHLHRYLHTMARLEGGYTAEADSAFRTLSEMPEADYLRAHALYQTACVAEHRQQYAAAIPVYQRLLSLYPHSTRTESTLIMLARTSILPAESATDARVGMDAVRKLLKAFPHTRFRSKAIGLAGRYHLLAHNFHRAAWCYLHVGDLESVDIVRKEMPDSEAGPILLALFLGHLHRLEAAKTHYRYEHTVYAIERLTGLFTAADASRVSTALQRDPAAGAAYLYYRIYHCENKPADLLRLAQTAEKIAARWGAHRLPPLVKVRIAEAFYQAKAYRKALVWAERAAVPRATDRVLFVLGATLHKLGRDRVSIARFEDLLRRYPGSNLCHGAREELALLYEVAGDLKRALKQYFLLGYKADAAFFVDARMSIAELESYYRSADDSNRFWNLGSYWDYEQTLRERSRRYTEREIIAYSLGIRYLRRENWNTALKWMRRVPRAAYIAFGQERNDWAGWRCPDPLTAIRELSRLQRAIPAMRSHTDRAAAMYRYARYYYVHTDLLLYNSGAWQGERARDIGRMWNKTHFTNADEVATREHMYEHETYARTMALCKEIAHRYPNTPSAPKALYRAACCAYYLSDFNEWWRDGHGWRKQKNQASQLAKEASRLMSLLVHRYPKDPLVPSARKYARVFAVPMNY